MKSAVLHHFFSPQKPNALPQDRRDLTCANVLVVRRQGRVQVGGSDACLAAAGDGGGNGGGVLDLDGRSQDTPFFQHMMPKNQLDETRSARRRSLLPSSVAKGPVGKKKRCCPKISRGADLCMAKMSVGGFSLAGMPGRSWCIGEIANRS